MDKILFSNSFKNLMVALGAKTSDSSYAVPLINKTSGAPQGYMEMFALASVLGALPVKQYTAGVSVNNLTEQGLYYINKGAKNITDLPPSTTNIGHLVVLVCNTWWSSDLVRTQIFVTEGGLFFRFANNDKTLAQVSWRQVTSTVVS